MIYFVQIGANGPIKIGYSSRDDAKYRLAALQTACPWPLRLLATSVAGRPEDERRFHKQFLDFKTCGEWFLPDQSLLDFISSLTGETITRPEVEIVSTHDILNELPSSLYEMAMMIAMETKVSIKTVLVEAVRDGLKAAKPQWDSKQRLKSQVISIASSR